jgi:hypothetical protein
MGFGLCRSSPATFAKSYRLGSMVKFTGKISVCPAVAIVNVVVSAEGSRVLKEEMI